VSERRRDEKSVKTQLQRLVVLLEEVEGQESGALLRTERGRRGASDVTGDDFGEDASNGGRSGGQYGCAGDEKRNAPERSRGHRLGEHRPESQVLEVSCRNDQQGGEDEEDDEKTGQLRSARGEGVY